MIIRTSWTRLVCNRLRLRSFATDAANTSNESANISHQPSLDRSKKVQLTSISLPPNVPAFQPRTEKVPPEQDRSFASLLRTSKLVQLGDITYPAGGCVMVGTIEHVMDDDLYIDFGWKFPCVCRRPRENANNYVKGTMVLLRVRNLELSDLFLGSVKELTLLEADAQLLGLYGRN